MEISDVNDLSLKWMKFLAARTKGEMEIQSKNDKLVTFIIPNNSDIHIYTAFE